MIKKPIKMLTVITAIIYTSLSISECVSVNTKESGDVFIGPPLAWASVYGMSASEYFAESDEYATVNGKRQHYYLYQWTDISDIEHLTTIIGLWIQQNGYDIGEVQYIEDDKDLTNSVKMLMKTKDANYSATIIGINRNLLLYINIYNTHNNTYDTIFCPLVKTKIRTYPDFCVNRFSIFPYFLKIQISGNFPIGLVVNFV